MDETENHRAGSLPFDPERLTRMSAAQLRQLHRKIFGCDSRASDRNHLARKIAWEMQARVEGRLPEAVRQLAFTIARHSVLRTRPVLHKKGRKGSASSRIDPRLPRPGSCLVRTFRDRNIVVKVLASGFEFDSRYFASLSAIAREVTGTRWNGFVFFGLARASHAPSPR